MSVNVFLAGSVLQFDYINHEGKLSTRTVRFEGMDYGENEWYSGRQWFMRCYDLERQAFRSFALNRIHGDDITMVSPPVNPMKQLLTDMFAGWILYNNSWNKESERHLRDPVDCMIEACGGDPQRGYLLHLFDYWSNDIQSVAAHFGLQMIVSADGVYSLGTVPPAPSDNHWWDDGKWNEPEPIEFPDEMVP